jgi:hypothetical protein
MAREMNRAKPFEFGAEHGYQYAVEKACEWLQIRMASENTIEQFKQFMED